MVENDEASMRLVTRKLPRRGATAPELDEPRVLTPPETVTVDYEPKPVLYLADGSPIFRTAGFDPDDSIPS